MSGVKGRSGRKSNSDEAKRLRIIEKAWDRCEQLIDDKENKAGDEVAKGIVLKDQTIKLDAEFSGDVTIMPMIEKDGKPMEHNVGT
jgi:hypothetical protein